METPQKEPIRIRAVPWRTSLADRTAGMLGDPPAYVKRLISLERSVDTFFALAERRHAALFRFVELRRKDCVLAAGHERRQKRAIRALDGTIERCNARWQKWLDADGRYDDVNAEIESFNRNYLFERNAALKYVPHNQVDPQTRDPIGPANLIARYPFASIPGANPTA